MILLSDECKRKLQRVVAAKVVLDECIANSAGDPFAGAASRRGPLSRARESMDEAITELIQILPPEVMNT